MPNQASQYGARWRALPVIVLLNCGSSLLLANRMSWGNCGTDSATPGEAWERSAKPDVFKCGSTTWEAIYA